MTGFILYVFLTSQTDHRIRELQFPTVEACERALQTSKQDIAKGGDAEGGFIMVCAPTGALLPVPDPWKKDGEK